MVYPLYTNQQRNNTVFQAFLFFFSDVSCVRLNTLVFFDLFEIAVNAVEKGICELFAMRGGVEHFGFGSV